MCNGGKDNISTICVVWFLRRQEFLSLHERCRCRIVLRCARAINSIVDLIFNDKKNIKMEILLWCESCPKAPLSTRSQNDKIHLKVDLYRWLRLWDDVRTFILK